MSGRYIDTDALEEIKEIADDAFEWGVYVVKMSAIRELPTADVVEVVRCEDCKYWDNRFDVMVCNLTDGMKGASDYCSYGERREDVQKSD